MTERLEIVDHEVSRLRLRLDEVTAALAGAEEEIARLTEHNDRTCEVLKERNRLRDLLQTVRAVAEVAEVTDGPTKVPRVVEQIDSLSANLERVRCQLRDLEDLVHDVVTDAREQVVTKPGRDAFGLGVYAQARRTLILLGVDETSLPPEVVRDDA